MAERRFQLHPTTNAFVSYEDEVSPKLGKIQPDPMESAPAEVSPASYASTLLQGLSSLNLNNSAMLGDFVLGDEDYQITPGKRGPSICFSQRVKDMLNLDWDCAAIVKLMGKPNSENAYNFMYSGLKRKWNIKLKGSWQLIDIPNGFFVVKFQLFEDLDYVLCSGPWIIAGQTLVVQKWRPDFDPLVEKISRMAVWVRILGLPVKYFKEFTMQKIGGLIGRVVKVDRVTLSQARGKFCRICVEVNLDEPLKPFVEVNSQPYGVVYEGISTICFDCGVYGHVKGQCPGRRRTEMLCWQRPPEGFHKLNVDGSRNASGLIGAGGVLRDCDGKWCHGFMRNIGKGQVLQAESWGLATGLQIAVELHITHIEVETDSAILINLINGNDIALHPLGTIISNCKNLMTKFVQCSINHIHREKNMVADCLAKRSIQNEVGVCKLPSAPAFAAQAMLDDVAGLARPRVLYVV